MTAFSVVRGLLIFFAPAPGLVSCKVCWCSRDKQQFLSRISNMCKRQLLARLVLRCP